MQVRFNDYRVITVSNVKIIIIIGVTVKSQVKSCVVDFHRLSRDHVIKL